MNKTAFLKQLENQLKIHEEAIKDLEENCAPTGAVTKVKQRRDYLKKHISFLGGPLAREEERLQHCYLVKTGGSWFRGDE